MNKVLNGVRELLTYTRSSIWAQEIQGRIKEYMPLGSTCGAAPGNVEHGVGAQNVKHYVASAVP